jgi:hypothetical protein
MNRRLIVLFTLLFAAALPACSPATPAPAPGAPTFTPPLAAWNGIPIMPQAAAGIEDLDSYLYSIAATSQEVQAFYDNRLPSLGWKFLTTGTGENGALLLLYQKNGKTLTISVIPLKDHVQILMTIF